MGIVAIIAICTFLILSTITGNGTTSSQPEPSASPTATGPYATKAILSNIPQIFISPTFYPGGRAGLKKGLAALCEQTIENTGSGKMQGIIIQSITKSIDDEKSAQKLASSPKALQEYILYDTLSTMEPYFRGGSSQCTFSTIAVGTVLPYTNAGRNLDKAAELLNQLSESVATSFKRWLVKSGHPALEFNWYGSYEMNLAALDSESNFAYWDAYYNRQIATLQSISANKEFIIAPFTTKKVGELNAAERTVLSENSGKLFASLFSAIARNGGLYLRIAISDRVGASTCNANPHTPADAANWVKQVRVNSTGIAVGINMELFQRDVANNKCKSSVAAPRERILETIKYYLSHNVAIESGYDLRYLMQQL